MPKQHDQPDWYFVCESCNCKFFHREKHAECPRCGLQLTSQEQHFAPWKLYRVKQAAVILAISVSKTYELIEAGLLPHHRIGGAIRISDAQIAEYLNETKRETVKLVVVPPKVHRPLLKHIRA